MKNNKNADWLSWVVGMTGGVLLWEFFKPRVPTKLVEAAAQQAEEIKKGA